MDYESTALPLSYEPLTALRITGSASICQHQYPPKRAPVSILVSIVLPDHRNAVQNPASRSKVVWANSQIVLLCGRDISVPSQLLHNLYWQLPSPVGYGRPPKVMESTILYLCPSSDFRPGEISRQIRGPIYRPKASRSCRFINGNKVWTKCFGTSR